MKYRPVTLYPLIVLPKKLKIDSVMFFECIKVDNFPKNEVQISFKGDTNTYTVIGDKVNGSNNSIVQGRFVRFNKEIKGKIKENPPGETELGLALDEYLEEETFFLYDTLNGVVIAEYNPRAVNVLYSRATYLLQRALYNCQKKLISSLSPIPVKNFLEKIKDRGFSNKVRISLGWANQDYIEKIGIGSRKLKIYGENIDLEITQLIKYRSGVVTSSEYIEQLNELKTELGNSGKSLKIYTDEGNFDLIKDNYVSYEINVDNDGTHAQLIDQFHNLLLEQYRKSQADLLSIVQNFMTMDDFLDEDDGN